MNDALEFWSLNLSSLNKSIRTLMTFNNPEEKISCNKEENIEMGMIKILCDATIVAIVIYDLLINHIL